MIRTVSSVFGSADVAPKYNIYVHAVHESSLAEHNWTCSYRIHHPTATSLPVKFREGLMSIFGLKSSLLSSRRQSKKFTCLFRTFIRIP